MERVLCSGDVPRGAFLSLFLCSRCPCTFVIDIHEVNVSSMYCQGPSMCVPASLLGHLCGLAGGSKHPCLQMNICVFVFSLLGFWKILKDKKLLTNCWGAL